MVEALLGVDAHTPGQDETVPLTLNPKTLNPKTLKP